MTVLANIQKIFEKLNQYQEILKKLKQDGNCFGNHTYSHKWLSKEKKKKIKKEIENTNQVIEDTLNYKVRYFRPAYGAINKTVRKLTDLDIIFWNIDSQDWKVKNSKQIAYNIINHAKDEGIILMHDMYSRSVNALKIFIPYLQKSIVMNQNKKNPYLKGQLYASLLFLLLLSVSILILYNEYRVQQNQKPLFSKKTAININLINRLLIFFISLYYVYVDYQWNQKKEDTSCISLSLLSSIITSIATVIVLYLAYVAYMSNDRSLISENDLL